MLNSQRLASCFLLCLALAACSAENENVRKGREWIELKEYDQARRVLLAAIEAEPKNVEARILISQTYLEQGSLSKSQAFLQDAQSISPSNSESLALQKRLVSQAAKCSDNADACLSVLEAYGPPQEAIAFLKREVPTTDNDRFQRVRTLLEKLSPADFRAALIESLDAQENSVLERSSNILWQTEKHQKAAWILAQLKIIEAYRSQDRSAADRFWQEAKSFGNDTAANAFFDLLVREAILLSPSLATPLEEAITAKDGRLVSFAVDGLQAARAKNDKMPCEGRDLQYVEILGRLGPTTNDAVDAARMAFQRAIAYNNRWQTKCHDVMQNALARMTGDESWLSYWAGSIAGSNIAEVVLECVRNRGKDVRILRYGCSFLNKYEAWTNSSSHFYKGCVEYDTDDCKRERMNRWTLEITDSSHINVHLFMPLKGQARAENSGEVVFRFEQLTGGAAPASRNEIANRLNGLATPPWKLVSIKDTVALQ